MEQFITVEIFRNKSNTFRGITFFPFLPSFLFSETFSSPVSFVRNFLPKFPYKWKALQEFVSHDPPLRLSPVPTRFSRNIFRFAFLTILDYIKLQMYVNNEVGNYVTIPSNSSYNSNSAIFPHEGPAFILTGNTTDSFIASSISVLTISATFLSSFTETSNMSSS